MLTLLLIISVSLVRYHQTYQWEYNLLLVIMTSLTRLIFFFFISILFDLLVLTKEISLATIVRVIKHGLFKGTVKGFSVCWLIHKHRCLFLSSSQPHSEESFLRDWLEDADVVCEVPEPHQSLLECGRQRGCGHWDLLLRQHRRWLSARDRTVTVPNFWFS